MEKSRVIQSEKSAFVNVVAWIFIVISGFWTFTSFIQNIIISVSYKQMAQAIE